MLKTILLGLLSVNLCLCFNYDLYTPVFKQIKPVPESLRRSSSIYFGYSVAQHLVKTSKTPYILVGAPRDSLIYNGILYNMSGAVYKCPVNLDKINDCEQIQVDFETRKSDEVSKNVFLDNNLKEQFKGRIFENQWFGVSLASTGNGSFSACAHKYVHYYNFTTRDEHAAYGACYRFSNDFNQEYKHVPCLLYSHEVSTFYFNNYAYCQVGTSLSMIDDQTLLPSNTQDTYLSYGMPGALNFRGLVGVRAFSKSSSTEYVYKNRTNMCKFDIETDRPTYDGYCPNLWDKHSYMGMSHVIIRRYMNKDKVNLIVTGAPRENLFGTVRFFTIMFDVGFGQVTRHLSTILTGVHKGSYFGFSMAACDLNGDKLDDLIVGAPYYSRKYEPNVGAIYIYMNNKLKGFTNSYILNFTGEIRSLFGHSIACVGDIDKDGYNDFAVGAPYEKNPIANQDRSTGPASFGAVYIFRGRKDPQEIKLSQKIYANQIKLPSFSMIPNFDDEDYLSADYGENETEHKRSLRAFGYSLSGGIDMDSNSYPDLLIGALDSNAVVLLRTRPVIKIKSYVKNTASLQEIDQKKKECRQIIDGYRSSENDIVCFEFEMCFQLNDIQPSSTNILPKLNYTLQAEPNVTSVYSRVYFNSTNTNMISNLIELNTINDRVTCESFNVHIKKDNYDFLRPIKFMLDYNFENKVEDLDDVESGKSLNDIKNNPIVHEDLNKYEFEANFKKDCGQDMKCITDLKLKSHFVNLIIGEDNIPLLSFKESDSVTIGILLENDGVDSEPAYATQIEIDFDQRLDFIKKSDDEEPSGFTCAINNNKKTNSLLCKMTNDIGGIPFGSYQKAKFNLTFSSTRLYRYANISSQPNIVFKLEAKTLSTDTDLSNNKVEILAKLKVRANLFLYGTRTPEQVFYSDSAVVIGESAIKSFEQIGPIIEHTYIINNGGPFSVNYFQLLVDWPYESRLINFKNKIDDDEFNGKHLLYLIERPTKIPNNHPINVVCSSYSVDTLRIAENQKSQRRRRQIDDRDLNKLSLIDMSRTAVIDCFSDTANCFKIKCGFYGDFSKDESISLKFTARLWNSTLIEDFDGYEKVLIKSHGKIVLSDDIHDDKPNDNENSVATIAYSNITTKVDKSLPIWVYILSVLAGLILLLISIVGFYMLGFFERKKYGDDKYLQESEKVKNTPY